MATRRIPLLTRTYLVFASAFLAFAPITTPAAYADKAPIYTKKENLAVGGYDVVSYFSGTPAQGLAAFPATYKGARFLFASEANRSKFLANPAAFAPQYGGYCAWAVSQGYTAPGNPKNYKVVDGKLYLNFNDDIQKRWEKNIPGFIADADKNWPAVLK
jgi:YHS domain-containing protein